MKKRGTIIILLGLLLCLNAVGFADNSDGLRYFHYSWYELDGQQKAELNELITEKEALDKKSETYNEDYKRILNEMNLCAKNFGVQLPFKSTQEFLDAYSKSFTKDEQEAIKAYVNILKKGDENYIDAHEALKKIMLKRFSEGKADTLIQELVYHQSIFKVYECSKGDLKDVKVNNIRELEAMLSNDLALKTKTIMPNSYMDLVSTIEVGTDGRYGYATNARPLFQEENQWTFFVDIKDAYTNDLIYKESFNGMIVNDIALIIALNDDQLDDNASNTYVTDYGPSKMDAYINRYYNEFWAPIEKDYLDPQKDVYEVHSDRFFSQYSVEPATDFAETFTIFVLDEAYSKTDVRDAKIKWMSQQPEIVALKNEIIENINFANTYVPTQNFYFKSTIVQEGGNFDEEKNYDINALKATSDLYFYSLYDTKYIAIKQNMDENELGQMKPYYNTEIIFEDAAGNGYVIPIDTTVSEGNYTIGCWSVEEGVVFKSDKGYFRFDYPSYSYYYYEQYENVPNLMTYYVLDYRFFEKNGNVFLEANIKIISTNGTVEEINDVYQLQM